jgi:CO/xanthine dehydrogenase Mo-binding subunit
VARRLLDGPAKASEGRFVTKDGTKSVSFGQVVAECYHERQPMQCVGQWVSPDTSFSDDGQGDAYVVYSFSATVAEVEVDIETGEVRVLDLWTAIDVGKAVNPDQVEAQIEGGTLQATGYALTEELVLDEGKILNPNLSAYIVPTTLDAPRVHAYFVEAPYSEGPFGAKGFGEVPMIGTPPAIVNAVAHAIGRRPRQAPATPERLLELLGEHKGGEAS